MKVKERKMNEWMSEGRKEGGRELSGNLLNINIVGK
jgi:hypothetical protein